MTIWAQIFTSLLCYAYDGITKWELVFDNIPKVYSAKGEI